MCVKNIHDNLNSEFLFLIKLFFYHTKLRFQFFFWLHKIRLTTNYYFVQCIVKNTLDNFKIKISKTVSTRCTKNKCSLRNNFVIHINTISALQVTLFHIFHTDFSSTKNLYLLCYTISETIFLFLNKN